MEEKLYFLERFFGYISSVFLAWEFNITDVLRRSPKMDRNIGAEYMHLGN